MIFIFYIFLVYILPLVYCHHVWSWLQGDNKILWNRYVFDSVEQTCVNFGQPVNNAAMCASGTAGWKCLTLYEGSDCTGTSHEEHINYASIFDSSCSTNFDTDLNNGFHIKYTTDFYAYSAKTYNC